MERPLIYPSRLINGRISLSEEVLELVGRRPVLNRGFERYINIFTKEEWTKNMETLAQLNKNDPTIRSFLQFYMRGATEAPVYAKSIGVSRLMIEYAQLDDELLLIPTQGGFQVYSQASYLKANGLSAGDLWIPGTRQEHKDSSIYLGEPFYLPDTPKIILSSVNGSLIEMVKKDPSLLHKISPREFEKFAADMLSAQGYEVTLTQATCDGGVDIYAALNNVLGSFLFLVECKQYTPDRSVGVSAVRQLYGNVEMKKATGGLLITTSQFSKPALEFEEQTKHRISLLDYGALLEWLKVL